MGKTQKAHPMLSARDPKGRGREKGRDVSNRHVPGANYHPCLCPVSGHTSPQSSWDVYIKNGCHFRSSNSLIRNIKYPNQRPDLLELTPYKAQKHKEPRALAGDLGTDALQGARNIFV